MHFITISKQPGERYSPQAFKTYNVLRDGVLIGTITQDFGHKWEVVDQDFNCVSRHSTIKAAVRVADKVLR